MREAQALAKLNHPHIVAVHDVGEHERAVWLAMEYVEGETLSAWLKQRRTWHEVLDVLTPAARGLSAAHDAGLVHRDIKPDNLMLGADGRVRVMDLGLVRALGNDGPTPPVAPEAPTAAGHDLAGLPVQVTRAGSVMGTPSYMSPEQFRGEAVDARTDVFSLCVTLWEALMGERPFAGDTLIELAANVLSGRVRPVPRDAYSRRVPGWLRRVCLQGLATESGRRFASMQALLDALSRGRARARARKWLVGVAVITALGGSAALYKRLDWAERVAECEADGADIFAVWNDEARAGVRGGILATGVSYAPVTAEKVMPFLTHRPRPGESTGPGHASPPKSRERSVGSNSTGPRGASTSGGWSSRPPTAAAANGSSPWSMSPGSCGARSPGAPPRRPQLASGLHALHAAGLLHRDLKPSNVLITPAGQLKIVDFGLAQAQDAADASASGTHGYLAPERLCGRPASVASDWYSVGVMLFEALTGRTFIAPPQLPAEADPELARLCRELLADDPAARPSGADVFARLGVPLPRPRLVTSTVRTGPASGRGVGRIREVWSRSHPPLAAPPGLRWIATTRRSRRGPGAERGPLDRRRGPDRGPRRGWPSSPRRRLPFLFDKAPPNRRGIRE